MLTPAQRKVKQELEQLKVMGQTSLDTNQSASPQADSRAGLGRIGFFLLFMMAGSILSFIVLSPPSDKKIAAYLTMEHKYNQQSIQLLNEGLTNKRRDLTLQLELKDLVKQAKDQRVPANFTNHQQDFLHLLEQRLTLLTVNPEQSQNFRIQLDVQQELAADSLKEALKRANIHYKVLENGDIQYSLTGKHYIYRLGD